MSAEGEKSSLPPPFPENAFKIDTNEPRTALLSSDEPQVSQPLAMLIQALQSTLNVTHPSSSPQYCLTPEALEAASKGDFSMITPTNSLTGLPNLNINAIDSTSLSSSGLHNTHVSNLGNGCLSPSSLSELNSLAQLSSLARQSPPVPQYQPPAISTILTQADTCLLTSLLALQQRQYGLMGYSGDMLLASLRASQGRAHSQPSSPSSLYKTELCRSWQESGSCRYGNKCQFAHGPHELRPIQRHPKYKTEICRTYAQTGSCPYGARCRFIHYFQRPTASQPLRMGHLSQQFSSPLPLPELHQTSSGSSMDSYLTNYAPVNHTSPPPNVPSTMYMPPLPPLVAEQGASCLSGLPSLTPQQHVDNCLLSYNPEPQRRLQVFRTFTEPEASPPGSHGGPI